MHAVASATGTSGTSGSAGEERGPDLRRQATLRRAAVAVELHLRVPFPRGQAQDETVVALPIQPVVPAQQLVIAAPVGLPILLAFAFHDVLAVTVVVAAGNVLARGRFGAPGWCRKKTQRRVSLPGASCARHRCVERRSS